MGGQWHHRRASRPPFLRVLSASTRGGKGKGREVPDALTCATDDNAFDDGKVSLRLRSLGRHSRPTNRPTDTFVTSMVDEERYIVHVPMCLCSAANAPEVISAIGEGTGEEKVWTGPFKESGSGDH